MPTASFTMPLRVRYVECDMQGRVFNAHYLTWVDMAHGDALGELFGGYQAVIDRGVDFVVAGAEMRFRAPARFDDRLIIHTVFHPPGNTSLRSDFTIMREDEVLAEVTLTHVCVDTDGYVKQPWPHWMRTRLPQG